MMDRNKIHSFCQLQYNCTVLIYNNLRAFLPGLSSRLQSFIFTSNVATTVLIYFGACVPRSLHDASMWTEIAGIKVWTPSTWLR